MKESLLSKFLKFSYGSWVGLFLGLVTTMFTTRILPPDAFGKASMFDLFLQVTLILVVFGTDQAFIRFFYEEQPSKRGGLLYNCLKIPVITTIIIVSILFLLYDPITNYLFGEKDFIFGILLAIGIITQLLYRYGQLVIRMQQKGNLYSLLQILQRVFNLIFIIIFFHFLGSSFKVLVISSVITFVLLVLISIRLGKEYWRFSNLSIKNVKHKQLEILRYGIPFVPTLFITWIFQSFDKVALRQWSDFNELGLYAAAMKLVAMVMILRTTFSTFWTPVSYEKFEKKPEDKSFFKYMTIIVSFSMFLVGIISIAAKDLIIAILGSDYMEAATIMPFLVFMPIMYTISETTVVGINFYKKTNWHIVISGISCTVNILGNWLLVPEHGAIGASISTAISFIIFFALRTWISKRYYSIKYPMIKIYLMIIVIFVYASYSIMIESILLNLVAGGLSTTILLLLFYKDLLYVIKNRKALFD